MPSQVTSRARRTLEDRSVYAPGDEVRTQEPPGAALSVLLEGWSAAGTKRVMLMVDEIDAVVDRREYAFGRGRTDLLSEWPEGSRWDPSRASRYVIECNVLLKGRTSGSTMQQGAQRKAENLDRFAVHSDQFLISDQRRDRSGDERILPREESAAETPVTGRLPKS